MSENLPLEYWFEACGERHRARAVKGSERLAGAFRFEIDFPLDLGDRFDPDDALGAEAAIELTREGAQRRIDGVVTDAMLSARHTGTPRVTVVLEPRLALLRHRIDTRLFRDRTAPQIVIEVLSAMGVKTELRLRGAYELRPYTVQLRESDHAFVHRLLEDDGIFYFFREGDVMVLGDSPAAYEPVPGQRVIPFRAGAALDVHRDEITTVGERASITPSKVTLRDFNPDHPSLDMQVSAAAPWPAGPEHYDYPGEYLEPDVGRRKAHLRAEAYASEHAALTGRSLCGRIYPGCVFTLADAPLPIEEGGYVVSRVDHDFNRDVGGFSNAFEALREESTFRPMPVTPAPLILNPVTGVVTGPHGADIHTDEQGRIKVHFHWDRLFPRDDTCSYWIPVLQDNTGHSVAIPRIGWEVLVHFLEGDPDRPVVLGRVYNAEDTFPYHLPEHKTRSALRSLSSPREPARGLTGRNEIQFEDLAGSELYHYHAQKDQTVVVANDKREVVMSNETRGVKRDEIFSIGANKKLTVGSDLEPSVGGDQSWSVGGSRSVTCLATHSSSVTLDRTITIAGDHLRTVGGTDRTDVAKNLAETIAGSVTETSLENNRLVGYETTELTVGGSLIETADAGKADLTSISRRETIGGDFSITAGGKIAARVGAARATTVSGALTATAALDVVLAGIQQLSVSCDVGDVSGPRITLKVGETELSLKDGVVGFKAAGKISITASGPNLEGLGASDQN